METRSQDTFASVYGPQFPCTTTSTILIHCLRMNELKTWSSNFTNRLGNLICYMHNMRFQIKISSKATPRKTVSWTCSVSLLLMFTWILVNNLFCGLKSINFVLLTFRVNLLTGSHSENFSISWFNNSIRYLGSLFEKKRFVSFANNISLLTDETLQISFMYNRKKGVLKLNLVGLHR